MPFVWYVIGAFELFACFVPAFVLVALPHNVRAGLGVHYFHIGPYLVSNIAVDIFVGIVDAEPQLASFLNAR